MQLFWKNSILATLMGIIVLGSFLAPFSIETNSLELSTQTVYAQDGPTGETTSPGAPSPASPTVSSRSPTAQKAAAEKAAAESGSGGFEILKLFGFEVDEFLAWIFAATGDIILTILSVFLTIAAATLDQVITISITEMANVIENIDGIENAWKTLRDLANIVLIFSFLAIGIGFILNLEKYGSKKLLSRLVIVALLINFSLFFTQVIIDTSNLLTVTIYNQTAGDSGLSTTFMEALDLQNTLNPGTPNSSISSSFGKINDSATFTTGVIVFGASILVLVATFVFFAAAILLAIRFIVLVFLMVLSPMAFAFMVLPRTQEYAKKWWDTLINQALFAPILFLFLWISVQLMKAPVIQGDKNFAAVLQGDQSAIGAIISFILVIGFLVFSLVVAKRLSVEGASVAMKWGGAASFGFAGWAGKNTVGRGMSRLAQSEKLKERASQKGFGGVMARAGLKTFQTGAKANYDMRSAPGVSGLAKSQGIELGKAGGKDGYKGHLERQVKRREDTSKTISEVTKSKEERKTLDQMHSNLAGKTGNERKIGLARIKAHEDQIEARGKNRKHQYAGTLSTQRSWQTLWTKVPRKNKEAAEKIREGKESVDKKLRKILEAEGDIEKKETAPEKTEGGDES